MAKKIKIDDEVWTEEKLECELLKSSVSGEIGMAQSLKSFVLVKSGDYFQRGQDEMAKTFRALAEEIETKFVVEACKRYEKAKESK